MAITTSLSCVDYLSIKFGCQNLNSDKEIYNHLSQEWFCRPLIKEFRFDSKTDSWVDLFAETVERGKVDSTKPKPNRRKNPLKVHTKGSKNIGFCANVDSIKGTKDASHFLAHTEQVVGDDMSSGTFQTLQSTLVEKDVSLEDARGESNLISLNNDECCSESELELMQIYGHEIREDYQDSLDAVPLKLSRKRTSNECLVGVENENLAKRMRPSIDITKMHQSRIPSSSTVFEDSDELFVPISRGLPEYL